MSYFLQVVVASDGRRTDGLKRSDDISALRHHQHQVLTAHWKVATIPVCKKENIFICLEIMCIGYKNKSDIVEASTGIGPS